MDWEPARDQGDGRQPGQDRYATAHVGGTRRRGSEPAPTTRRGVVRAAVGGAALLAVAGTGYAALKLGSGHGSGSAAAGSSPSAGPSDPKASPSATSSAHVTVSSGFDDSALAGPYAYSRESGPDRTVVRTESGTQVAVFTDGARTVCFSGASRGFTEPSTTTSTVTTDSWVRVAPKRWSEGAQDDAWFHGWFQQQIGSTEPDLFGLYAEYAAGAPNKVNGQGVRYAGQARFGELTASDGYQNPLGDRDDRADFYDYLGVDFDFPDGTGKPHSAWYGDLDCSGLVRILFGYRMGYPMYLGDGSSSSVGTLPRHSWSLAANGPGVWLFGEGASSAPEQGELSRLQPGDLLFFAEGSAKSTVDHCGIYFGADQYGRRRFLSSRMGANGPTFGDADGMSVIGGTGIYSADFRGARRV